MFCPSHVGALDFWEMCHKLKIKLHCNIEPLSSQYKRRAYLKEACNKIIKAEWEKKFSRQKEPHSANTIGEMEQLQCKRKRTGTQVGKRKNARVKRTGTSQCKICGIPKELQEGTQLHKFLSKHNANKCLLDVIVCIMKRKKYGECLGCKLTENSNKVHTERLQLVISSSSFFFVFCPL